MIIITPDIHHEQPPRKRKARLLHKKRRKRFFKEAKKQFRDRWSNPDIARIALGDIIQGED